MHPLLPSLTWLLWVEIHPYSWVVSLFLSRSYLQMVLSVSCFNNLSPQYGRVTVAENVPVGTVILEIQATDGDEPATGSSYIIYQMKEGDPNNSFIIETDPETNRGFVKINKVNRWVYSSPLYIYIHIYTHTFIYIYLA